MEEKNKEFTLAQEHTAPPPECAALPPEVLPPDTVLPGEASAAESAAALKKKTAKWKKIAIMLVGLSAMTAVAVTGGGTAEDPVPATPDTPPVQQEPYVPPEPEPEPLAGVLHYTIYNDTFDDSGVPLILAEGTVDMAALSDTPLALPQPETPSDGSYAFLGWAGRYDTAGGKVWTTVPDPLTADFAASIRPGDTGERSIVLRAAWRLTEQSRYPWSLTLDDGVTAVTYEAAVPYGLRRRRVPVRLPAAHPRRLSLRRLAERGRGEGGPSARLRLLCQNRRRRNGLAHHRLCHPHRGLGESITKKEQSL